MTKNTREGTGFLSFSYLFPKGDQERLREYQVFTENRESKGKAGRTPSHPRHHPYVQENLEIGCEGYP